MQSEQFEWDDAKAAYNIEKHGVSFEQTASVFFDSLARTFPDPGHSTGEEREITIGSTFWDDILVVVHTTRGDRTRIISARRATRAEKRNFMSDKDHIIRDQGFEEDDIRPEYDFDWSKGVVGKYYPGRRDVIHVTLDADVAQHFSTAHSVNAALRQLIAEGRTPTRKE